MEYGSVLAPIMWWRFCNLYLSGRKKKRKETDTDSIIHTPAKRTKKKNPFSFAFII